jgi:hypothetical protein
VNCTDVIEQRPVLSLSFTLVVAAVAYAAIAAVMRGRVDPIETGLFAVVFGVGYVGVTAYADSVPCLWCR